MERDIDTLCMNGFLKKSGGKIHVHRKINFSVVCSIVPERGDDLIRRVYREYPYYAINSTILTKRFSPEEAEDILRRGKIFHDYSRDILFTIGYEGRALESFINTLIQNGIKLLCDVRKNPASRKFGFSGKMLKRILNSTGIKYISIPALGIESEKRASLFTTDDYHNLFSDYRASMDSRMKSLEKIHRLVTENHRIALMCYEKDPQMCHRNIIREFITGLYETESINL